MAQRSSSGRGGTATGTRRRAGNQTPGTPGISESDISRMKADDIRGQLRRYGVSGISALRKPELVKTLARTLRAEQRGAGRTSTGPAGRASGSRSSAGRAATTKKATRKAAPTRAKAAPARKTAKTTPARKPAAKTTPARKSAAKTTPARKSAAKTTPARKPAAKAGPARKAASSSRSPGGTATAGLRTGRGSSRSVRSSQLITSLSDRPERPGRSLVTTNHDVIRRWAQARNARPATISGTEREGRAGVLTFHVPGYRESSRVREITWDEWFRTFDLRKLNLIYQEQLRDGRQSTFFRTESPDREDG